MSFRRSFRGAVPVALAALTLPLLAHAADEAKTPKMDMASMMPKPGAEHARLAKMVGHWTAHGTMTMQGMDKPMDWTGSEDVMAINNGMGIMFVDRGSNAMPMEGHGMETWDPVKKKYVGAWMDNMGTGVYTWEGTVSDDGKTSTDVMTGNGMTGQVESTTMVNEMQDENHRTMKFYQGTDTSVAPQMTITYARTSKGGMKNSGK